MYNRDIRSKNIIRIAKKRCIREESIITGFNKAQVSFTLNHRNNVLLNKKFDFRTSNNSFFSGGKVDENVLVKN